MLKKVAKKEPPKKEKINPKDMHKSYLDRIEADLSKMGVVMFDAETNLNINEEFLELPADITDMPSRSLGESLNAFTQQKIYMRTLLGRVEAQVEDCKRKYYEASEDLYKKLTADKFSETAKERILSTDEATSDLYNAYVEYKRKQSIVEYSIQNIEDIIFMLSREVTRRSGDFAEETRNHNVGKM